ncbi:hypothetical protein DL764_006958 [Monosporascus ibericus]|uniref:Major facilitator superfamily (MFS) profile domain-containing protein n=1 Tax=Monosporascus ibericus TaxID=155417 RepID=A0A4V1X9X7_9PEZI|nr:hypothetical protein DL764_006958 [Monosporascus ibericus]
MNEGEKKLEHTKYGQQTSSPRSEGSPSPPSQDLTLPGTDSVVTDHDSEDRDENGRVEPPVLEMLSRVSSGPPYSVFSPSMKWWIVVMNCFSAFMSPTTAQIYFPAIPALAEDLGVSIAEINLTLTTYMILQGLAPTVFGDFGDVAGRRPAFIISFAIYLGANIGLALQREYAALLILRMLQSGGSSGTLALSYAVVADIAPSSERGKYMGIVGAGQTMGPALGPLIGGILSQCLGWPSIFWFLTIITVVWMIPYVLAVPETGRKVVGNGSVPPQGWNMTLLDYFRFRRRVRDPSAALKRQKIPIPNPFNTLAIVLQKDMAMILFYNAILYIGFMTATATLSSQFEEIYGFSQLQLGLCYLPLGVGTTIASVGEGFILDWNYRRVAKKLGVKINRKRGDDPKGFPIEKVRLQVIYLQLVVGTGVYIGWGWALEMNAHVATPLVLSFFIGLCITGAFQVINILLVDLNPESPATATAANNLVRCAFGAVATAVIEDMIKGMGRGWAFTFIALLIAAFSPLLWVVQKYGPGYRDERRQKMILTAEKKEAEMKEKRKGPTGAKVIRKERSTSTSPPPEPLEETFMIEGIEADDRYRMVEDELLIIAQRFTAHLHAAEYQRLKEASKSRNAKTIKDISRPVVGPITELAKRKQERKARAEKQRLARKKALADQDDTESESDDHYRGTSLFGLMESPVKKATRLDSLVATSTTTRAAAGLEETKHRKTSFFGANPRSMLHKLPESRQSKDATLAQAHDETSGDDIDAPEPCVIPKPDQGPPRLRGQLAQTKSEHPATKSQRPISPSQSPTDQIAIGLKPMMKDRSQVKDPRGYSLNLIIRRKPKKVRQDSKLLRFEVPLWNPEGWYPPLEPFKHYEHGADADTSFKDLLPEGVEVTHSTPTIGTEVRGVQLSSLNNAAHLPILEALDYAGYFGRHHIHPMSGLLEGYPEVYLVHRGEGDRSHETFFDTQTNSVAWHTEVSYEEQLPGATYLYVLDKPETGGDTLFANTAEAHNRLSLLFQERLHRLKATHSGIEQADASVATGGIKRRESVVSEHPIVRTHPTTG